MGYIRHHAIIVTTYDEMLATQAHVEACRLFGRAPNFHSKFIASVSTVMKSGVNSDFSFCVFPDGSKEGWDHSDAGDDARADFISWLNDRRYEDRGSPFDWVEIQYGDDEGETVVVSHSDQVDVLTDA